MTVNDHGWGRPIGVVAAGMPAFAAPAEPLPVAAAVTAPGVVAVLRCIARRMIFGGAA